MSAYEYNRETDGSITDCAEVAACAFALADDEQPNAVHGTCKSGYLQVFKTALDCRNALKVASTHVQVLITENASEVSALNLAAALNKDNELRDIYIQRSQPTGLFISRSLAAGVRGVVDRSQAQLMTRLPVSSSADLLSESDPVVDDQSTPAVDGAILLTATSPLSPESKPASYPDFAAEEFRPTSPEADSSALVDLTLESLRTPSSKPIVQSTAEEELDWLEDYLELAELDECEVDVLDDIPTIPLPSAAALDQQALYPTVAQSPNILDETPSTPLPTVAAPRSQNSAQAPAIQVQIAAPGRTDALVSAFVSGRGGVGKSSLAVLTAVHLLQQGSKVALVDLDLQFGDIAYLLGAEPVHRLTKLDIGSILSGRSHLSGLHDGLLLVMPPEQPELAETVAAAVPELFAALRQIAEVVIVNTSCFWDEMAAILAHHCDQLLFTMDQRASSVSACRQAAELCVRLQIPSTKFSYLLNRCSKGAPITDIDVSLAVGGVDVICVADGGHEVDELLSLGLPHELLRSQPLLAESIAGLAALVAGTTAPGSVSPGASLKKPPGLLWSSRQSRTSGVDGFDVR